MIRTAIHTAASGMMINNSIADTRDKHALAMVTDPNPSVWISIDTKGEICPPIAPPVAIDKEFDLYLSAASTSEYGDGPSWAKVTVNQEFVNQIFEMLAVIKLAKLSGAERYVYPDEWENEDEYRLIDNCLHVSPHGDFWFTSYPKHSDYNIETRGLDMMRLSKAIASSEDANELEQWGLKWTDAGLIYCPSGDFEDFLNGILERESESVA